MVHLVLRSIAHPDDHWQEKRRTAARVPLVGEYVHDGREANAALRKVVKVSIALHDRTESAAPDAIVFYEEPGTP